MKSVIELELELSNAKLKKMTETVKQLGTKLKKSNDDVYDLGHELSWYKDESLKHWKFIDILCRNLLSVEEAQGRAIEINSHRSRNF